MRTYQIAWMALICFFAQGATAAHLSNATISTLVGESSYIIFTNLGPIVDWAIWGSGHVAPSESKFGGNVIGDQMITTDQSILGTRFHTDVNYHYSWTDGTAERTGSEVNPGDLRIQSLGGEGVYTDLASTESSIRMEVAGTTVPQIVHVWGYSRLVELQMVASIKGGVSITNRFSQVGAAACLWRYSVEFTADHPEDKLVLTLIPSRSNPNAALENFGIGAVAVVSAPPKTLGFVAVGGAGLLFIRRMRK